MLKNAKNSLKVMKISEFNFIERYLKPLATDNAGFNLSEDVAIPYLSDKNNELVVSKDLFVENVHFLASDNPRDIASRLILSNISDIASCGAIPRYYMLGLPKRDDLMGGFYDEFCAELSEIQKEHNISLIGGDTVAAKNDLFFSVTIFGEAPKGKILKRSSAEIGDDIYVTGTIGDSFLGLQYKLNQEKFSVLSDSEVNYIVNCHNKPNVPVLFANALLLNGLSRSSIDISDGLIADLGHICEESGLCGQINLDLIPMSSASRKLIAENVFKIEELICSGEDYQIIFTGNKKDKKDIFTLANRFKIGLNYIGEMMDRKDEYVEIKDINGNNIKLNYFGYEH